jgi:hypothetical protein
MGKIVGFDTGIRGKFFTAKITGVSETESKGLIIQSPGVIMIFLLLSAVVCGLSLAGTGCLTGRLFGLRSVRNPCLYWWLGFFAVSATSMFLSLFFPVNTICLIAFFVAGAAGLPLLYGECKQSIAREPKVAVTIFIYITVVFLAGFSFLFAVTDITEPYDTALYHAQAIRWMNEYGTPPGLGNLHARLAFNSSWLSFAALFDNGPWDSRSEILIPALSWLGAFLYFFYELLFTRRNGIRLYALCMLLWSLYSGHVYPALYYDDPVHILNAIVVLEIYYLFDTAPDKSNKSEGKTSRGACILMLSAGAFMVKPSGVVSLIFTGVLFIILLFKNKKHFTGWLKVFCPAAFALIVWITRNLLLSGYPLYPMPILPFPFDWTMAYSVVKANYDAVVGWARMPGPGYIESLTNGFLFWFKPWLIENLLSKRFFVLAILPASFAVFFWFLVIRFVRTKKALFFLAWSTANILYWFLMAPDIRFGGGFFWVSLALSLLFLFPSESVFQFSAFWDAKILRWTFRYVWALVILGIVGLTPIKRSFFTVGAAQSYPVKEYTVRSSDPFAVWIPLEEDDRTGNSPLPSAPGPVDNIEMREYGNLGKGFRPVVRF